MVLILSLENLADACQLLLHYWQDFGLVFHYFFFLGEYVFSWNMWSIWYIER